MTSKRQRTTDVKVGVFLGAGVLVLGLCVFLIGQERRLFEKPVFLKAKFSNVAGLKQGAQVRLAGVDVGIVSAIEFPDLDANADQRVVALTDVAGVVPPAELKIRTGTFKDALNLTVTGIDPNDKLELTVEVRGEDIANEPVSERILVRVRGREMSTPGKVYFRKITQVTIVNVKDAGPGAKLMIGDGLSRRITAVMRISSDVLDRIRYDSEARIDSAGLLGDKTIDISIGSLKRPAHQDGDMLRSGEGVDLNTALLASGEIIDNVLGSTEQIRALLEGFRKAGGERTVVAAMQSIQDIAEEIQKGQGLVHQLIFDPKSGGQYKDIVSDIKSSTGKLDKSIGQVDDILHEVRTGESLTHHILYGDDGQKVVTDARSLITSVTKIVDDMRTEPGFVHNLIYQRDSGEMMANANAASADVKAMTADMRVVVADVKQGRGTVGLLLKDPSVFEDIKALFGNVRRNDAVKALVRYAIEQEERRGAQTPSAQKTPQP